MIAVATGFNDNATRGVLIDETKAHVLPFLFDSVSEAQAFLDSAERAGANVWPGMSLSDLQSLVRLWRDAYKRPNAAEPNDTGAVRTPK